LKDAGEKLSASDKGALESAVKDLRSALEKAEIADVEAGIKKLESEMQRVAMELYKNTGSAGGSDGPGPQGGPTAGAGGAGSKGKGGDVIDAEFEESK
jgi:molecular chaperone DnaK